MNENHATPLLAPTPLCAAYRSLLPLLDTDALSVEEAASTHAHTATCAWCQLQLAACDVVTAAVRRHNMRVPETRLLLTKMEEITRAADYDTTTSLAPPAPPTPSPPWRPSRPRLTAIGAVAAVLVVALLAGMLAARSNIPVGQSAASITPLSQAQLVPADWKEYRDPDGYFTVWIPPDWIVQRDASTAAVRNQTGSFTYPSVENTLGHGLWTLGGINVYIHMDVFVSDYQRRYSGCGDKESPYSAPANTTLAGLPALFSAPSTWFLDTQAAQFQIDYRYHGSNYLDPGGPMRTGRELTPTPMPANVLQANQRIVDTVIKSFRPVPAKPLICK